MKSANTLDSAMLVRNLVDDDPRIQRNARDYLIALGPPAVEPMLEAWHKDPSDYKMKVGVVWVINHMLRNNVHAASTISERLADDDIHLLVNALSDSDKTVRLQATELLYYLKDKRVVKDSVEAIRDNNNENGVFNNVLILKEIVPSLDEPERTLVRGEIVRLVPDNYVKTHSLALTIDP